MLVLVLVVQVIVVTQILLIKCYICQIIAFNRECSYSFLFNDADVNRFNATMFR